MVETEARPAETPAIEDWTDAPWPKLERALDRLQKRIDTAQDRGNVKVAHSVQRLLLKSRAARMLAVRRVTQENQGKKTAGIDGVKAVGPLIRLLLVERLRHGEGIRAQPVRRVLIPKPGKPGEWRPLGIPVLLDRAHQTLVTFALEPQWEARFEPNSYGFRPGRGCHDAIEALSLAIVQQPTFVLDADIKGCFDGISHQALLAKLEAIPHIHRAVKAWLRAGALWEGNLIPTTSGSPQGGCVSPLLANIALHGLEQAAASALYPPRPGEDPRRRPVLVRYADDFVVLHHRRDAIEAAHAAVATFLAAMGLQLHPTKTSITHTLHPDEGRVGFDFLGFTVRQYPCGQTHASTTSHGGRRAWKTLITPSKEAIKRHDAALGARIRQYRGAPQAALIAALNPLIRGWATYYRTVVASKAFTRCDIHRHDHLWRWACWRHPSRGRRWIAARYWSITPGQRWQFTVLHGDQRGLRLRNHTDTLVKRHVKVRGRASPYDGNLPYWAQRLKDHPLTTSTLGRLLAQQHSKCAYCGLTFTAQSLIDIDHRVPTSQGGSDLLSNKQALHRHCHDQKSATDRRCGVSLPTTT